MRPHDPAMCDYVVIEARLEWGRPVVRSARHPVTQSGMPVPRNDFEDEEDTNPEGRTLVGPLLGAVRRPGRPTTR